MLHQDLPTISAHPVDGVGRWVIASASMAALISAAIVYFLFGPIAAGVLAACVLAGAAVGSLMMRDTPAAALLAPAGSADFSLVGAWPPQLPPGWTVEWDPSSDGEERTQ